MDRGKVVIVIVDRGHVVCGKDHGCGSWSCFNAEPAVNVDRCRTPTVGGTGLRPYAAARADENVRDAHARRALLTVTVMWLEGSAWPARGPCVVSATG